MSNVDICDNLITEKVNGCDSAKMLEKSPTVIDLDKNRIVLKRRRLKLWTRPLSNIFKNPFTNLASTHILGTKTTKTSNHNNISNNNVPTKPEVKIDIALIKKLEDEIYKRENNIRGESFEIDDETEARFVFKNDTSAFTRGNKPLLLLDTRKLDPLLLKQTTACPVYQNIDEALCVENDDVVKNPTKSIIIVDNSNFYPILMRYDINNEVIENLNGNVEKCHKQFEMTKALKTGETEQHKNDLNLDNNLDFPRATSVDAPKNSISCHHPRRRSSSSGGNVDYSTPLPLHQRRKRKHEKPISDDVILQLFNRAPLLRVLTEDDCDYFLATLKTKISPQLCEQLKEMFGSKKSRLKFMIYKKLYRHFQTNKSARKKHHHHCAHHLSKSSSLPNVIDEHVLHKFCDNWKNYCHNTTTAAKQLLNWSTPDLINDRIYITGCPPTSSTFMRSIARNNRASVSTEGNSTLSTNIGSGSASSSTSRNSNISYRNNKTESSNVFIRKLHPIRQRASFRLKRHSVGSTDVVKTWVYRRR